MLALNLIPVIVFAIEASLGAALFSATEIGGAASDPSARSPRTTSTCAPARGEAPADQAARNRAAAPGAALGVGSAAGCASRSTRVQLKALKKATPAEKLERVARLYEAGIRLRMAPARTGRRRNSRAKRAARCLHAGAWPELRRSSSRWSVWRYPTASPVRWRRSVYGEPRLTADVGLRASFSSSAEVPALRTAFPAAEHREIVRLFGLEVQWGSSRGRRGHERPAARRALAGVRAALVDLDGTLLDTGARSRRGGERDARGAGSGAGRARSGKRLCRARTRRAGRALPARFARARAGTRAFSRAQAAFAAHYERENGRRTTPYPGALEGLSAMRDKGLRLACVTNKPSRFTLPLLESAGLASFFDAVMTADIAGARKPDPAIFLAACRRLAVAPQEACAIGDSANDADGARAAGCRVLLVPYGYREGRALEEIASDGVVATLAEAAGLLSPDHFAGRRRSFSCGCASSVSRLVTIGMYSFFAHASEKAA
ncbi:MAG: HAD-IA family hydrolase [Burkholderiales bacterium]|nr:HAD-IA family hydrolase [Burkholderiales bacterium]